MDYCSLCLFLSSLMDRFLRMLLKNESVVDFTSVGFRVF